MNNELFYGIALKQLKGVGDSNAKELISYAGSAEQLFRLPPRKLKKIKGVGAALIHAFEDTYGALLRAEQELKFIAQHNIQTLFYYDKRYPKRLLNCADAPLYLFCKGEFNFNNERFVNIVGTRRATVYGRALTEKMIEDLAAFNVTLVSGLAYGIDICAHKAALKYNLQNIAVLAHGLDRIYPIVHKGVARSLQQNGAIVSDFLSGTNPDRQNFPSRNRIVAGMTDATIVIESAITGGALITADIANSYHKDVFAFPGRVQDEFSEGCHQLIKDHKAHLVTSARDIITIMGWDEEESYAEKKSIVQSQLLLALDDAEKSVVGLLKDGNQLGIDKLCLLAGVSQGLMANILLQLEMKGVVQSLPGKFFKLS